MLMRDHKVLPATNIFIHKYLPLVPRHKAQYLGQHSIYNTTEGNRLDWPWWPVTQKRRFA